MYKNRYILTFALSLMCDISFAVESNVMNKSLKPDEFRAFEIGVAELKSKNLNLDNYNLLLVTNNENYVVVFVDKTASIDQKGSGANAIGFEVEISKSELRILKSYYAR